MVRISVKKVVSKSIVPDKRSKPLGASHGRQINFLQQPQRLQPD
jgi:hypothetical protein